MEVEIINKLEALPQPTDSETTSEADIILDTTRLAALVHCSSIADLAFISQLPQGSVTHLEQQYTTPSARSA
jgi:hypothetical protein